ncbi:MAG: hypothetical protein KatS3mg111_2440 [Pirellulaceae bacterium]|nr:MAG: hypothetical protein KatS3mg111_2440 [Pirellulaceae bacterium]
MTVDDRLLQGAILRSRRLLWVMLGCLLSVGVPGVLRTRADEDDRYQWHLSLKDGSICPGRITASTQEGVLGWQALGFSTPFLFDVDAMRQVAPRAAMQRTLAILEQASQQFAIDLIDDSVVVGHLRELDAHRVVVQSMLLGTLPLKRSQVRSIRAVAAHLGAPVTTGTMDAQPWTFPRVENGWKLNAGGLVTERQGAIAVGLMELPPRARIDFTLSWKNLPDFLFLFGTDAVHVDPRRDSVSCAARLEVWDNQLALVREVGPQSDLQLLPDPLSPTQAIELSLFVDQLSGRAILCDCFLRPLATVELLPNRGQPSLSPAVGRQVMLVNLGTDLALERFCVFHWDGILDRRADGESQVVFRDGTRHSGTLVAYQPEQQTVLVQTAADGQPSFQSVPLAALRLAHLSSSEPSAVHRPSPAAPMLEVVLRDGSRLRGHWLPADDGMLQMECPSIDRPAPIVRFKVADVRGIRGHDRRYEAPGISDQLATLRIGTWQLNGSVLSDSPEETQTAMFWKPFASHAAAEILGDVSGEIQFRRPLPAVNRTPRFRPLPNAPPQSPRPTDSKDPPSASTDEAAADHRGGDAAAALTIEFRSGDSIHGRVTRIDANGIAFESAQTAVEFAPHDQVRRVQLRQSVGAAKVNGEKLKRLKTIPRNGREDPPTHLILSTAGDYLRGRLMSFDGRHLRMEVRGHVAAIPAARVAEIIWLYDRTWKIGDDGGSRLGRQATGSASAALVPTGHVPSDAPFEIHVVQRDGRRVTVNPVRVEHGILIGRSKLLGDCAIPLDHARVLFFGPRVEQLVREKWENPWTISLAPLPRDFDSPRHPTD